MATLTARIPKVSRRVARTVQKQRKQIVARNPIRRFRARGRVRTTRRIVVLTATSLGVAGIAAGTTYFVARRFFGRAIEEHPVQEGVAAEPAQAGFPKVAVDGAKQAEAAEVAI